MRDLIVVGLVLLSLPYAFRRPFVGLMVFSWLAYMRPQNLCWGFARGMRLSFFVGIAMVAGWLAFELGKRPFFRSSYRSWLLVAMGVFVTISLTVAFNLDRNVWRYYFDFIKIIVVSLFTIGQVDNRQRLRAMLWVIAVSLGFYGFKAGLWGALTGGVIRQGPGGMLGDNNDFALAMVMILPILFYLGRIENKLIVRRFCDACFFFSCVTVLMTHSRGGFLSMVVVFMFLAWRSGKLFQASFMLALAGVAFLLFAPDHVIERLLTLKQGTLEGSAGARWRSWTAGLRMIDAHPFFGVGLRNYQEGYRIYAPELVVLTGGEGHVAHNSYLQIWAEAGSIAFLVYMLCLGSIFTAARKVRRAALGKAEFAWALAYSRMFEITAAGFMVGSFFLNRGHFDLTYHWVALAGCMVYVFRLEFAKAGQQSAESDSPEGEEASGPMPVPVAAPAGFRSGPRAAARQALPRWSRTT